MKFLSHLRAGVNARIRDLLPAVAADEPVRKAEAGSGGGGTASPLTTKGDLYGFSTDNDRVPVGADGLVLTADASSPTGVAWSAGTPGPAGDSAYQTWLDAGNVGTEAAFLASLEGPPGADSTVPGPPGGVAAMASISAVQGTPTIAVGRSAILLHLQASAAARIRLYTTAAHRTADAGRAAGTLPAQGSGCLLEFIATGALLEADLAPAVVVFNYDGPTASLVYANIEPVGATCTLTLKYLALEP